ncbi:MAG: hypothetical protein SH848_02345, partial [Saprospiraceae bacterium]|nr:hypothetical protein [Saprospiraceae bacterium]
MKTVNLFSKAHKFAGGALVIILLLSSLVAQGQDRWSIEFRPGINFPTQKLGDADLKTDFGFEGSLAYRFMPHLSVYGGW